MNPCSIFIPPLVVWSFSFCEDSVGLRYVGVYAVLVPVKFTVSKSFSSAMASQDFVMPAVSALIEFHYVNLATMITVPLSKRFNTCTFAEIPKISVVIIHFGALSWFSHIIEAIYF